ncbi:permease-like cell division protein FtsX [Frankia sp. Cppng1_Ct_nod]|uniref:permease-like cell division protein FtsX n=1 Tax=Frankia sp. Cppng1_Ct_nod TaxID=2897162 RepID=UPI001041A640|nr:permease-like cell division protein FtsX [Frankia sp. Cppng1_Ct_nod]
MRIGPLLRIVGTSLRRNLAVTLAVIVTVTICLTLFGAGLLLRAQVRTVNGFLLDRIQVVIDLTDNASDAERDTLAADLRADPLVQSVVYEDKAHAFARFRRDFRNSPDVVSGVNANDLPASLRLTLTDPRQAGEIINDYTGRDGVDRVRDQRALLAPLYRFLDAFTVGAFVLAAVQAFSMVALIYTMIRISAYGRRQETAIMRLVGGTNRTIRAPFVLESAIMGMVGGTLAAAALIVGKVYLVDHRFARQTAFPLFGWDAVWAAVVTVFLIGTTASAGMAAVALRRHLRI